MKQKMFFIMALSTIVALPLLTGVLFGPPRLVVKPGAASHLDEMLAQWTRDGIFTGSVLIAQDGVVFLNEGYGLADRKQKIPNTPQTRFHLGSLTKQFTAMGILILQSQGKLSVQDPLCNFFANCPTAWQGITIHHLLTHTAGFSWKQGNELYRKIESAGIGPVASADQAQYLGLDIQWLVDSRPGERYAYGNFDYILLAHIIEQVSGQSYADFLNQAIFTPLNMHDTGYPDGSSVMARVYNDRFTKTGGQFGPFPVSEGAGGLYSTAEDLLRWDQALYTDQLLTQAEMEPMFERFVPMSDYPPFGYGYGWLVTKILGRPVLGGAGGGGNSAFTTMYLRLPVDGLTLIVVMNQGDIDPFSVLFAIAGALFLSDLIFVLTAIAFLLLLAVLLAAQKNHRVKTTWVVGILWLLLAAPLALVFSRYLAEGRGLWTLLPLGLVLLYMLAKALLDFVFRIDLRRNRMARLATLALMCLALFSLVWIAFGIHPSWGTPVLIALGILAASLIILYRNEIKVQQQHTLLREKPVPCNAVALTAKENEQK
jgi:CubicO group peptidase (beta-lactamase class C family)